jgi:HSP20 family protein
MHSCAPVTRNETRGTTYRPPIDVIETPEAFRLEVELPGVERDDLDVDLKDGVLSLKAKVEPRHKDAEKVHLKEYGVGNFERRIRLGDRIDSENVKAELERGVLTLHLPKVKRAQARRIEIA